VAIIRDFVQKRFELRSVIATSLNFNGLVLGNFYIAPRGRF